MLTKRWKYHWLWKYSISILDRKNMLMEKAFISIKYRLGWDRFWHYNRPAAYNTTLWGRQETWASEQVWIRVNELINEACDSKLHWKKMMLFISIFFLHYTRRLTECTIMLFLSPWQTGQTEHNLLYFLHPATTLPLYLFVFYSQSARCPYVTLIVAIILKQRDSCFITSEQKKKG